MPTRRKTGDRVKTSLVLPEPLWRRAKLYALDHRTDLQSLVIEALERFLPKPKEGTR